MQLDQKRLQYEKQTQHMQMLMRMIGRYLEPRWYVEYI